MVTVTRNDYAPSFESEPYSKEMSREASVNEGVVSVSARDDDIKVRSTLWSM